MLKMQSFLRRTRIVYKHATKPFLHLPFSSLFFLFFFFFIYLFIYFFFFFLQMTLSLTYEKFNRVRTVGEAIILSGLLPMEMNKKVN